MARRDPFKQHRFPKDTILLAIRWYPLSYRDVRDLLAERGILVDAATIYRWVQKFGREIRKRAYGQHRSWRGLQWHVDETCVRVDGRWSCLWRAVDQLGQLVDFRLTARRNASAARAFMRQASDTVRCYQPMTVVTDKAHSYAKVIEEMNFVNGPDDRIWSVDRKHHNNRIEAYHTALKQLLRAKRAFQRLTAAVMVTVFFGLASDLFLCFQ